MPEELYLIRETDAVRMLICNNHVDIVVRNKNVESRDCECDGSLRRYTNCKDRIRNTPALREGLLHEPS